MLGSKPVSTPMLTSPKLSVNSRTPLSDPTEYRKVVGSLQYLAFTRPDLSYAVNRLSQYMHTPTTDHWSAVKRVLRYLSGSSDNGILLQPDHQKSVARSSTEVEYRSVANTSSKLRWINFLLQELGIHQLKAPVIYCDSVGAT